jgi:outer membrane protein OmpA-like peptidoglycan-associated protein
MRTLIVCALVVSLAAGCADRKWGKCARYGFVLGGIAGGLAGGLGVTEFEKNEVSTGEKAAGIGGGIAGGMLIGTLLGHVICDPLKEAPPPPPATRAPEPAAPKPIVTLHGPQFDFDKATLKPDGKGLVDEAVRIMQRDATLHVSVEGHTDAVGTDAYNQRLSERRAAAVRDYMIEEGIAADRITSRGWGNRTRWPRTTRGGPRGESSRRDPPVR